MAEPEVVRIELDGRWSAIEMAELLSQFQFLYDVAQFSQVSSDAQAILPFFMRAYRRRPVVSEFDFYSDRDLEIDWDSRLIRKDVVDAITQSGRGRRELKVQRINFASPGIADLAGVGKLVEQVRVFATDILDRYLHRHDRRLKRESEAQDILAKKIQNARDLIALAASSGLDPDLNKALLREVLKADYFIEDKVLDGKIKGIGRSTDD